MPLSLANAAVIGNELALVFSDGREAYVELGMLRRACPCAVCQGEPDALGRVVRPRNEPGPGGSELRSWQVVGGYGLQLSWGDGHSTGIYGFPYLLRLAGLGGE